MTNEKVQTNDNLSGLKAGDILVSPTDDTWVIIVLNYINSFKVEIISFRSDGSHRISTQSAGWINSWFEPIAEKIR